MIRSRLTLLYAWVLQRYQKRKGSSGQSQNTGGKLQGSTTKQQEKIVTHSAKDAHIAKEDLQCPHSNEVGRDEAVKRNTSGNDNSKAVVSLGSEQETISIKPTSSEACPQEFEEKKAFSAEDDSDSEDEEKPVIVAQDAVDKAQSAQGMMNNSRTSAQNIISGLSTLGDIENDDSGEWETVEVKGRGNRKKAAERANQNRFHSHQHGQSQSASNGSGSKKSKTSRSSNRKQRANMRKMVREILSNVLDRVEEEVQKRRQPHSGASNWGSASPTIRNKGTMNGSQEKPPCQVSNKPKDLSMRDIVVSRRDDSVANGGKSPVRTVVNRSRQRDARSGQGQLRRGADGLMYREKPTAAGTSVDHNTGPTLPKTLSAVSATSARNVAMQDAQVVAGDTSSGDSGGGSKQGASQTDKDLSPPLPTLLSPENANSASSSVASSLDTSHAGHQTNHIASQQRKEKDVGYHLLDVCDRLTRDINIFMKRREYALDARRRERGAVLMALQGTVSVSLLLCRGDRCHYSNSIRLV